MLLKTLKHRAAVNAFHDSKLSELMHLDTLVQVLEHTQAATAPTQAVSVERPHTNITNITGQWTLQGILELEDFRARLGLRF